MHKVPFVYTKKPWGPNIQSQIVDQISWCQIFGGQVALGLNMLLPNLNMFYFQETIGDLLFNYSLVYQAQM